MEFDNQRLIAAVLLLIIGLVFFIIPEKAIKALHFTDKSFEPSEAGIKRYKFGGLFIAALGAYYVLAMFGYLPKLF